MGPLWSVPAELGLDWRLWDEDLVVYVHLSGDTHALSPAASGVLATLLEQRGVSRSSADWLHALTDAHEPAPQDGAQADADLTALEEQLAGLERIGAVRRQAA